MVLQLSEAYSILGVTSNTSIEEVKKVYKRLALKTHPDKNPNDPDAHKKFLKISEAYKRISDPSAFEDEMDDLPNEEEMEAMFEMMFAEMMGMNGMHEISPEMFAAMEEMMMNGGEDDEILASMFFGGDGSFDSSDDDGEHYGDDALLEMLMHELMRPGKMKRGKSSKSSKSGRFTGISKSFRGQGAKQSKDSDDEDSDEWTTESESEEETPARGGRKQGGAHANTVKSPVSTTGKSSKLKGTGMERAGSVRMGEGSRRIPPRMSSFRAGKSSRSMSTDADAKQNAPSIRLHTDSGDEKHEFSLRSAEAKASSHARRARDQAETNAKAAQLRQTDLELGDRVLVQDRMLGTVAYVGSVHYAKGVYVGVVMDQLQDGKNTGTVKGTEYFKCPTNKKALVVPLSDVFKV